MGLKEHEKSKQKLDTKKQNFDFAPKIANFTKLQLIGVQVRSFALQMSPAKIKLYWHTLRYCQVKFCVPFYSSIGRIIATIHTSYGTLRSKFQRNKFQFGQAKQAGINIKEEFQTFVWVKRRCAIANELILYHNTSQSLTQTIRVGIVAG